MSASDASRNMSTLFSSVTRPRLRGAGRLLLEPEHPASKNAEKDARTSHARIV